MNKMKKKMLLMALLSALGSSLTGCHNEPDIEPVYVTAEPIEKDNTTKPIVSEDNVVEENKEEVIEENIESTSEPTKEEIPLFSTYKTITATTNVNIREKEVDGEIIGVLPTGSSLRLLEVLDNGWYKVEYYGEVAYVSASYAIETVANDINRLIEKIYYATDDIKMIIPSNLTESGVDEEVTIPALECLEVYEEYEDYYLVKTNDYIGYVGKTSLEELQDTFVVIDISDQELRLYFDNEVFLSTPVVTGHPSTPSDKGLFEVYDISYTRDLIGPGYQSYVDIMMKYNGGEGMHDAEHHVHDDGFDHGWRDKSEFGGKTYKINGSHGCINMLHEDVMTVSDFVEIGTKVLVKE